MVDVSDVVRSKAVAAGAYRWLDELTPLVTDLENDWSIAVCRPYDDASEAFVARATLADGLPAVLKLVIPRAGDAARNEIIALRLAGRASSVQLLRADVDRGALLIDTRAGDVHQWNVLQSTDGFKLIDPDGLFAEAEYDLGVIMREDPKELLDGDPTERSAWLARHTNLDETAIWQWGVVERVSNGLLCTRIGVQPVGRQMLDVADRIAHRV